MIELDVKYIPYNKIAEEAVSFAIQYGIEEEIPVPIEEVVEFDLGFDIILTENMQRDFDVEGFTTFKDKSIYVDDFIYKNRPYRYRFTLAHEVGHIVLHKSLLEGIELISVTQWEQFIDQVDIKDYNALEFQGYAFGGLVLVQPHKLKTLFEENIEYIKPLVDQARSEGLDREQYLEYAINAMASILSPKFDVSNDVLSRRIIYDDLDKLID
jgi:Zn-dependent peptidase ImmA (M78 family)